MANEINSTNGHLVTAPLTVAVLQPAPNVSAVVSFVKFNRSL
jgi:hypothetical protein